MTESQYGFNDKIFTTNNSKVNYERILEVLRKISEDTLLPYQRWQPSMKDLKVISLTLTGEYMGIDRENHLFGRLPFSLLDKIERNVYNIV